MFGADLGLWDRAEQEQVLSFSFDVHQDPIRLEGDFYRESSDTFRSAFWAPEPESAIGGHPARSLDASAAFPGPHSIPSLFGDLLHWPGYQAQERASCQLKERDIALLGVGRFTETDPPAAASVPSCGLAACTFYVKGCSPARVGNHLVDFLETQVTSSLTKINHEKLTIKADVFIDGATCTLKIRIYSGESGAVLVEFLRRRGCCLCFGSIYRQAGEYLQRFAAVTGAPGAGSDCRPPPRGRGADAAGMSPLLDMAGLADSPGLQAESAAALVDQAQDDEVAASLCTAHAFEQFKALLRADETAVAHPTAQMLSHLSLRPEAMACFADEELMALIANKVRSEVTSSLVQRELAQVLSNALSGGALALSAARVAEDVKRTLALARRRLPAWCGAPARHNSMQPQCECKGIRTPGPGLAGPSANVQPGGAGLA